MRPVHRGDWPKDGAGAEVTFADYGHARPHLIARLGDYCSFCEVQLSSPDVEHIRHKKGNPDLEREWSNLLLACRSCNSTKSTQVTTAADVEARLWPHLDRTFEAYVYEAGGVVRLATQEDPLLAQRAHLTAEMVGLLKLPGHGLTREQVLRDSDRRYRLRSQAWEEAIQARADLDKEDSVSNRRLILISAGARGFWSVWLTVFRDDAQMVADLIACRSFPGTATDRLFPLPATPTT